MGDCHMNKNNTEVMQMAFQDVEQYPRKFMYRTAQGIHIPVTYKQVWDDGFGARGWKLNATIGDPDIIASTRETGQRINTSVFVHDILDHFLSGFGISGHRSEAMALIQLGLRTGSNIRPDYEQMVKEDLFHGRVNGESLQTFLPEKLNSFVPSETEMTGKVLIGFIKEQIGEAELSKLLVERFFELGTLGKEHALRSWNKLGLESTKRIEIGQALQKLLVIVDTAVEKAGISVLNALITLNNEHCWLETASDVGENLQKQYSVAIA
jgi:hypothetical protein